MYVFSSLFKTIKKSIRYKVENLSGKILCWVKKPKYSNIRRKLVKAKYIDDNTGFTIINNVDDVYRIMIVFQDFKLIFGFDNIFSLKKLNLSSERNLDQLYLLSQLTNLTKLDLSDNSVNLK